MVGISRSNMRKVCLAGMLVAAAAVGAHSQQVVFQSASSASGGSTPLTRIHAPSTAALQELLAIASSHEFDARLDVWAAHAASHSLDIAASPDSLNTYLANITAHLPSINLTTTTLHSDIHPLIHQQREQRQLLAQSLDQREQPEYGETWHERYHSYQEIQDYLHHIASTNPNHAQLVNLGTTHENRSLTAIKLGHFSPESPESQKPGVLIIANQHAREWISAASALHLIHQILADELGEDDDDGADAPFAASRRRKGKKGAHGKAWAGTRDLLSTFDITILPLANPDGYAYSWTSDRMWRKNRQPVPAAPEGCVGIDLNSNWDAHFLPWPVERACSEAFPGTRAFEARESAAIARFIAGEGNRVHSVVDLHSYGQLLTYPFAFSCAPSLSMPDEEDLLELSFGAVRAMRDVHSHTFHAGRHCELAWEVRGSALDWAYGYFPVPPPTANANAEGGRRRRFPRRKDIVSTSSSLSSSSALQPREGNLVKWSFALELRDGGTYGFLLPDEQIRPSGQEAGALMRYMLEFIAKREHRI